ncbi:hypothetical protein [Bacillus cytotoxicus]|uniref:hypothetical protein n=1 Tax=Bacillus cytotoxicus TaxID=580165 RepID=UPI000864072C|nr:hypothetical protein [Bacillus cytotoxicus]MDH2858899.1 hypothetical protein [Bacillus cytotoxicus]MDH2871382.1 hypothetical protein [Bacillus cytotoxicus]MDH2874887.1 hypothetical protein [Bacillus cytotoxicus]MDH2878973.1 hypothetical protein [Bacillus cytotoxicus]MDH2887459.1 hypothetical protein [Bacillus cytotoxicus]
MKYKMQLECRDKECRTVMFGHFLEGMNCVKCGGPTIEKPYSPVEKQVNQNKNSELTIQVSVDTTKALEGIKELTAAANECVEAFEKLEKVMSRFENKPVQTLHFNPVTKITANPREIALCKGTQI